jgi:serine/threonine protein phosphatase PrpC
MADTATLKSLKPQIPASPPADGPVYFPRVFAMLSDPGRVRRANQDACAALPEHGAYVVCDGVGGAAAGEVASHLAAEIFLNHLSHLPKNAAPSDPADPFPSDHPHSRLQRAVCAANHAVFQRAQKSRTMRGMATTLVAALWELTTTAHTLWLAHVGDSRCYLFRGGALLLLTQDHSLVEEQVRAGLLSRAQAESSPIRNIITRAVGSTPSVEPDIAAHPAQPGDIFLLASDGLTRELNDDHIAEILTNTVGPTLDPACQALVEAANNHGGRDNITVMLIACP